MGSPFRSSRSSSSLGMSTCAYIQSRCANKTKAVPTLYQKQQNTKNKKEPLKNSTYSPTLIPCDVIWQNVFKKFLTCQTEDIKLHIIKDVIRAREVCESRGGRPGLCGHNSPSGVCGRKATLNERKTSYDSLLEFRLFIHAQERHSSKI